MLICRCRPPSTSTCPTPLTLSLCRRSTLSAYSVMSRTGCVALSARLSTGAASGSCLSTRGCWIVFGRRGRTPFTLSRTSCAATSVSFSRMNDTITWEMPSEETERRSSIPLIVLTASSILSVISVSICSGAAPGCSVVTVTVGKSIFGKRSTPSRVNEKTPMTVSERMRTVAKTGRLTQSAASHCIRAPEELGIWNLEFRSNSNFQIPRFLITRFHLGSVCELPDVLRRDVLAGLQPFGDFQEIADPFTNRDDPFFRAAAGDHVDAAGAGGRQHRRRRDEHARRARRLLDARRGEQPGLEHGVRVRHHRLHGQRPLIGLERRRHVFDPTLELPSRVRVDLEGHGLADGHHRDELFGNRQAHAQRVHADDCGDFHALGDVIADRCEALGDDGGERRADGGIGE